MIKKFILLMAMCMAILLSGCNILFPAAPTATPLAQAIEQQITEVPLATAVPTATMPPAEMTQVPLATQAPQYTMPPQNSPSPPNTMEFYSCYAYMVSFNPINGWAEFDYFYMHKGQDAIDYLVEHEGYSQADAEDEVNNYADGEFVCENNNPGLRTIDLNLVPVKLMYYPDGSMVTGAQGVPSSVADVTSLYNLGTEYLYDHFFFYIHCDANGNILLVEQVYWC